MTQEEKKAATLAEKIQSATESAEDCARDMRAIATLLNIPAPQKTSDLVKVLEEVQLLPDEKFAKAITLGDFTRVVKLARLDGEQKQATRKEITLPPGLFS